MEMPIFVYALDSGETCLVGWIAVQFCPGEINFRRNEHRSEETHNRFFDAPSSNSSDAAGETLIPRADGQYISSQPVGCKKVNCICHAFLDVGAMRLVGVAMIESNFLLNVSLDAGVERHGKFICARRHWGLLGLLGLNDAVVDCCHVRFVPWAVKADERHVEIRITGNGGTNFPDGDGGGVLDWVAVDAG